MDLVGADELHFALVARSEQGSWLSPDDRILPGLALEQFGKDHDAVGLTGPLLEQRIQDALDQVRKRLIARCRNFVDQHPQSARTAEIQWIAAQCLSLRPDRVAIANGWVGYTASHVLEEAEPDWQVLLDRHGSTAQAALARLRLAELALRRAEPQRAYQLLAEANAALDRQMPSYADRATASERWQVFAEKTSYPSPGYYASALRRTRYLIWLIDRNLVLDKPEVAEALAALMRADPTADDLHEVYQKLAQTYGQTDLADNLRLAVAMATPDLDRRIERIAAVAETPGDAAIRAWYELGRFLMNPAAARWIDDLGAPAVWFARVIEAAPNPWHELAAQHVVQLESPTTEGPAR